MTKRQRVSDLISKDEIMTWQKGDIVTIKAGTGAGKSYFIKNSLYEVAKANNQKILMLIHRRNCVDQFQEEIERDGKTDVIDIRTYQSIESSKKQGIIFELSQYDYIISDEWHFFISDASFNKFTDLSLNAILEADSAVRVFMSATGSTMKQYLCNEGNKGLKTIDYELPIEFDFIKDLQFYYDDEALDDYMEQAIETNTKTIFFIQSAKKAFELYDKYREHCLFNCSIHNEEYGHHVDRAEISKMLKNEKFEKVALISTSVLDSGVNIVDSELNNIVADIRDTNTLLQCIGRKRIVNNDDYINLKIKARGGQSLSGTVRQAKKNLDVAIHFKHYGEESTIRSFYRNINSNILYLDHSDGKSSLKLNELMYFKTAEILYEVEFIQNSFPDSKHKYCDYIAERVLKIGGYTVYEYNSKQKDIESFLSTIEGKRIFRSEQEEIIKEIDVRVNGRQQRSFNKLNWGLETLGVNYIITRDMDSRRVLDNGEVNPNRNQRFWMIVKHMW